MLNSILHKKSYRLSILILLITVQSGLSWSNLPIPTTIVWIIDFITIYTLLQFKNLHKKKVLIVEIYFWWLLFETIRGAFIAENYWEWKQLITGFFSLSLPLLIYPFTQAYILQQVLSVWIKTALPLFIIFLFIISSGAFHFYLGPVFLLGCFIPIIPKKWKILIGSILILMLFINLGARSQGTFNIFQDLSSNEGKYVEHKIVNGQVVKNDLSTDTRTFIYEEVITSAIKHNYIIWGRTPARGNDSMAFGSYNAEELKTGKYERHSNEVCQLNIFTWLGIIGMALYSLIYIKSSFLAVYRSKSSYIKILGCYIAFRWAYSWVEDINLFDIANISLWMMISIGLSAQFRNMNDKEFADFIKSIFLKKNTRNNNNRSKL